MTKIYREEIILSCCILMLFNRSQPAVQNNSIAIQMKFDLLAHLIA